METKIGHPIGCVAAGGCRCHDQDPFAAVSSVPPSPLTRSYRTRAQPQARTTRWPQPKSRWTWEILFLGADASSELQRSSRFCPFNNAFIIIFSLSGTAHRPERRGSCTQQNDRPGPAHTHAAGKKEVEKGIFSSPLGWHIFCAALCTDAHWMGMFVCMRFMHMCHYSSLNRCQPARHFPCTVCRVPSFLFIEKLYMYGKPPARNQLRESKNEQTKKREGKHKVFPYRDTRFSGSRRRRHRRRDDCFAH